MCVWMGQRERALETQRPQTSCCLYRGCHFRSEASLFLTARRKASTRPWDLTLGALDEERLQSILGVRNIPKILEAELLSFPLGRAPRDAIRIFVGSNKAFALFTTLARTCSSPTVRNCGRRSVLLAVLRRDGRQGLRARRFQPGHQTWTEARDSGCYPGVSFCAPLGEGQGQRSVSPTGRCLGGGGGGGVLFQVHSYLTGK